MMKKNLLILLLLPLLACNTSKEKTSKSAFDGLLDDYFQDSLELYRINGTFIGDTRYNDTLPNFLSSEFEIKEKDFLDHYKDALVSFNDDQLSPQQLMSKKILLRELELELEGKTFHTDLMPINQMWTFQLTIGQLASGKGAQPFKTPQDYRNWLIRLQGYLDWIQSAEDKMKIGIEKGYVLPKSLIVKVLPQLEAMTQKKVIDHLFYTPIKNMPDDFSSEEQEELKGAYTLMLEKDIIPAYQRLYDFMSTEYLAAGRNSSGFNAFPDGAAYYDYAIRVYTTTDMDADEIHNLGLDEVLRIRREMEKVKTQVGFKGGLNAFFEHVRSNPDLMPFSDPQEVIDNFNAIYEKIKPNVDQLFSLQPETPFEIRRVEAFREASAAAHYNPGSLDGTRPGVFYVPIPDVKQYNVYSDEDLFLHEAIPGHHFQISLQQENKKLPDFRKNLFYSAFSEGWALYTESLGKELGLYQDPYQYFGMLGAEMHRAVRLVVDTGLHAKGWTREQAIEFSLDNEAESLAGITSEIERYMANPAQALSYKIGQLKIRSLRRKAEEAMGDQFDIRVFHQKILESGAVPLSILENKINHWIYNPS
jgi:uncharacterized protein (DUF885 family)